MFRWLGKVTTKYQWIVLGIWIGFFILSVTLMPSLSTVISSDQTSFLPEGTESSEAMKVVQEAFPEKNGFPAIVVLEKKDKPLSDKEFAIGQEIYNYLNENKSSFHLKSIMSIHNVPQAKDRLISKDGQAEMMLILFEEGPTEERDQVITEIQDHLASYKDLEIRMTGPAAIMRDVAATHTESGKKMGMYTTILVLILLLAIFRSPVAPFLSLITVGMVVFISEGLIAFLGQNFDLSVSNFITSFLPILLYGAGTDYYIFLIYRMREELAKGSEPKEAVAKAIEKVGSAITSSAATTIFALILLVFAEYGLYRTFGPSLGIAMTIMLLASITLTPSLLSIIGSKLFWPKKPAYFKEQGIKSGNWGKIAGFVVKKPLITLLISLLLLTPLSLFSLNLEENFDMLKGFPKDIPSRQGFDMLERHYPVGEMVPTTIVIKSNQSFYSQLDKIEKISTQLTNVDGISVIQGPTRPNGTPIDVDFKKLSENIQKWPTINELKEMMDKAKSNPSSANNMKISPEMMKMVGVYLNSANFISEDGKTLTFDLILNENPYSRKMVDQIPVLRENINEIIHQEFDDANVWVGGETASNYDILQLSQKDSIFISIIVTIAVFLVLVVLLRSLIAPIYLIITIALSFLATIGTTVMVSESLFGLQGINYVTPFLMFIFLIALGSDYNIYIMSRIKEEKTNHGLEEGVKVAIDRTGGVITSAGVILAGTFAALMTTSIADLIQMGFAIAFGILLDTFIVRPLLVPSIVLILKKWNWWPSK